MEVPGDHVSTGGRKGAAPVPDPPANPLAALQQQHEAEKEKFVFKMSRFVQRLKTLQARNTALKEELQKAQNFAVAGCKCFDKHVAPDFQTTCAQKLYMEEQASKLKVAARPVEPYELDVLPPGEAQRATPSQADAGAEADAETDAETDAKTDAKTDVKSEAETTDTLPPGVLQ
jgi:hypothetical protein